MRTILCENCDASIEGALPDIDTQHLRSKVILSDGEILETRQLVKQDEKALERYDAELKRLRGLVEKLEEGRLVIEERLREHRGILSPLRRLPVEILDKVFTLVCLGKEVRRHEGYSLRISGSSKRIHIRAPAYDLSHVSSSWRRIVTNRPHLWTSIHLDISSVQCDVRPLLKIYLKNSGTRPLKIKIVEKDKGDRPERWLTSDLIYAMHFVGEHGLDAFRMLFKHMPRCSELELDVNWEVLSNDGAIQWNHISFPILRTFRNSIDTGLASATVPGPTAWFWNALRNAPNLRDVHAERVLPPHLDMIPYHQLTCLQVSAVDGIRRLFHLLQDSPHLQLLKIWYLDPNDDEEDIPVRIELPRLRSLSIDTAGDYPLDRFSALFASLVMPNLESLRIENSYSPVDIQYSLPTTFFTMLQHSSSSLRKLTLDLEDTCLADHTLANVLDILPNLMRFEVMLDGHSDLQARPSPCITHLLDKLTISAGSSSSCSILAPKLIRLFLHENSSRLNTKVVKMLLDMAESRSHHGLASLGRSHELVPFHKVQLTYAFAWLDSSEEEEHGLPPHDFDPFCDPSVVERIKLLKQDGVKCVIEESD